MRPLRPCIVLCRLLGGFIRSAHQTHRTTCDNCLLDNSDGGLADNDAFPTSATTRDYLQQYRRHLQNGDVNTAVLTTAGGGAGRAASRGRPTAALAKGKQRAGKHRVAAGRGGSKAAAVVGSSPEQYLEYDDFVTSRMRAMQDVSSQRSRCVRRSSWCHLRKPAPASLREPLRLQVEDRDAALRAALNQAQALRAALSDRPTTRGAAAAPRRRAAPAAADSYWAAMPETSDSDSDRSFASAGGRSDASDTSRLSLLRSRRGGGTGRRERVQTVNSYRDTDPAELRRQAIAREQRQAEAMAKVQERKMQEVRVDNVRLLQTARQREAKWADRDRARQAAEQRAEQRAAKDVQVMGTALPTPLAQLHRFLRQLHIPPLQAGARGWMARRQVQERKVAVESARAEAAAAAAKQIAAERAAMAAAAAATSAQGAREMEAAAAQMAAAAAQTAAAATAIEVAEREEEAAEAGLAAAEEEAGFTVELQDPHLPSTPAGAAGPSPFRDEQVHALPTDDRLNSHMHPLIGLLLLSSWPHFFLPFLLLHDGAARCPCRRERGDRWTGMGRLWR